MFLKENSTGLKGLSVQFDASSKPSIAVDVERYQAYLDGSDMTQAEKEEFLQTLWGMIVSFVEWGYGVHPLQEVCGKKPEKGSKTATEAFDAVCSDEAEQEEKPNGFSP
jgi:hypothetical protein